MRTAGWSVLLWVVMLMPGGAATLLDDAPPRSRVVDEQKLLSPSASAVLSDSLEIMAKQYQFEAYVVVLKETGFDEAAKLSDRWQTQWVPKGDGGVFVYSELDKKYLFTPTPKTMKELGSVQLVDIFRKTVAQHPMRESLDVVVSLPVQRVLAAVGKFRLEAGKEKIRESELRADDAKSQETRWKIVAGITGLVALLGMGAWLVYLTVLTGAKKSRVGGVPPEGLAYRNPPREERRAKRRREAGKDRY